MTGGGGAHPGFDGWLEPGLEWRVAAGAEKHHALIRGILPRGALAAIGGSKGIGKTWILDDLVLSVANGVPFLGRYPVEAQGRVLVIQTEGDRGAARGRYDALARGKGLDPATALRDVDFVWRRGLMLDVGAHLNWLKELAAAYVLIIDDTLRDTHGRKENDNDAGAELARDLRTITNEGPTFLCAQHFGKAGPDTDKLPVLERFRGNSAFIGALDSALLLERHRGVTRTAVEVYCRDDLAEDPFTFTWPGQRVDGSAPVTLDWQPGEESVSSALELVPAVLRFVEGAPGGASRKVIDHLPNRRDQVAEAIEIARKQGRLEVRDTPFRDVAGRRRTRKGLYATPFPHGVPEIGGFGERRESRDTVPGVDENGALFVYGNGAGNGENGVLDTAAGGGVLSVLTPLNRGRTETPGSLEGSAAPPVGQIGAAGQGEICGNCGAPAALEIGGHWTCDTSSCRAAALRRLSAATTS